MVKFPEWLQYASEFAGIFSNIFLGVAGLYFTFRQWKFAKGQPKRDLEAHRRALRAAKLERLIADFAVILRHSIAQKTYMYMQMIEIQGQDPKETEKHRLDYLYDESEGLSLAMTRARLESVDEEILKIGNEQFAATGKFVKLQELLFERIDKHDGNDLTLLSNSVKEARALSIQKCDELEAVLEKETRRTGKPHDVIRKSQDRAFWIRMPHPQMLVLSFLTAPLLLLRMASELHAAKSALTL